MTKKATACSPLRRRMIEDMVASNLVAGTQRGHIFACKLFAAFLGRSPETATFDDIGRFQLHLIDSGRTTFIRNRIMTGFKFLLRVTIFPEDVSSARASPTARGPPPVF